jgi:glycosyltransferase involved in cell wall biosynthesis
VNVVVVTDRPDWALARLYAPLSNIPGVTVMTKAEFDASDADPDIVHYTYWGYYGDSQSQTVVSVHHVDACYLDTFSRRFMAVPPGAIIVSDHQRVCQLGEMGLATTLIPYWTAPTDPTPRPDEWRVGILGEEQPTKRFDAVRAAALHAGVPIEDGTIPVGGDKKYANIDDFYRRISVFVKASYVDAGSLPMLDALARGIPVVSVPSGMAPAVISEGVNGYLTTGDIDDMTRCISAVRDTPLYSVPSDLPHLDQWLSSHEAIYRGLA